MYSWFESTKYFYRRCIPTIYGFHQVWYQGIVKAAVFGVFEDLKSKISEGLD